MSDLLPISASPQERAISEAAGRVGDVPVPLRDLWNPNTCPPPLLAWLAWAFSVDQWDSTWTEEQQREFIRRSVEIHRFKGTIGAVRAALAALAFEADVQEWFNQAPAGDPYTFRVLLIADQVGVEQGSFGAVFEVIERTKNLRSHMSDIQLVVRSGAGPRVGVAAGIGAEVCLTSYLSPIIALGDAIII